MAGYFFVNDSRMLGVYDVYRLGMKSKDLIEQLIREGWVLRGVKGSHHVFIHPFKQGHISVPHPKKDLGLGLVRKLQKQAGLKEH